MISNLKHELDLQHRLFVLDMIGGVVLISCLLGLAVLLINVAQHPSPYKTHPVQVQR